MSTGAIIGIVIAVIVVVAVIVLGSAQMRRARMRRQFGPEYDRLAQEVGPRKADAELAARQRRVEALGIHPLSAQQQTRYSGDWAAVQEQFVDTPAEAVSAADVLIWNVMRDRGYPADDRNASLEALSVYHARPLDGYRQTREISPESATTEQLREALIRFRALFDDLVGTSNGTGRLQRGATADNGAMADNGRTGLAAGEPVEVSGRHAATNSELAADNSDRIADTPR
jgi:hypothetical protein